MPQSLTGLRLFRYTGSIMALDYTRRMQFIIGGIVGAVLLLILVGTILAVVYDVPSCTDRKQNQDEEGVDCGGGCPYLCTVRVAAPRIEFVRAVSPQKGRTDVIAYVQNVNKNAAAKRVLYTIDLHAADGMKVGEHRGYLDLPPGETVAVFVPAAAQGSQVSQAFMHIDTAAIQWFRSEQHSDAVTVSDAVLEQGGAPRITATLTNPSFDPAYEVQATAVVFDAAHNAIAASRTVLPAIKARSSTGVVFTWNTPFEAAADHIEVSVVSSLP